jgi:hypothetical protein
MQAYAPEMPEPTLPRVPQANHHLDFVQAVREGGEAGSDFAAYGGPLTECAMLGLVAMQFPGQRLEYEGDAGRFANHEPANEHLDPPYRAGWSV